ncbi:hypothetical protein TNCV_4980591 [Trichonephila clavipes]|nr:hypothetical protein TNCV_4980591 [Trichonephila clavipes]
MEMVSVQHLLTSVDNAPRSSWETRVGGRIESRITEPDYPYTILFEPNFGVHIPRSFENGDCVYELGDLTWDPVGVELRFFQVGRSPLTEFGKRINLT